VDIKNRGIVVSIQGYSQKTTSEMASEAVSAGCVALRLDKPVSLRDGLERVPVIGLRKCSVLRPAEEPYITVTPDAVQEIANWADLVAIDCRKCNTRRFELTEYCKKRNIQFVADIETIDDWKGIQGFGYAWAATTFSVFHKNHRPDIALIEELKKNGERRIIAEGNFSSRVDVRTALQAGAHMVCIGAAIANVYKLTRKYTTVEW
jgi:putative N-acetylmannosamine-6-phosphate epimerase